MRLLSDADVDHGRSALGDQFPALQWHGDTFGIPAGAVRLHGYLTEEDKQAIVGESLLHLNTSQGEGWGLCVLEAAALGVPTVAFDTDGLVELLLDHPATSRRLNAK